MNEQNRVRLLVGGSEYAGWKEVEISAGIERQARDFTLSVTDRWPGQTEIPRRIKPGDVCEVFIGDDKVLTGYVDATPVRYDARAVSVGVKGRSKTADLIDCSAINQPGRWSGLSVEKIAAEMANVYGIDVISEVSTGAALTHAIEQGETVFESIDRMLKLRQILATDDEHGRLIFIQVAADSAETALELGKNILECDAPLDFKDVYSDYTAKGQRAGNDWDYGATVSEVTATALDSLVKRKRVLLIKPSGQNDDASAKDRVEYERSHRRGKALQTTYTVQGWRQANGKLWRHNQKVRIVDPMIELDAEYVIAEITYKLSDGGMKCVLKVGPKDGYISNPAKAKVQQGPNRDQWADVKPGKA